MSGTIDQGIAAAEVPADDGKFFFVLKADENAVTELRFRKNANSLFSTLFFALDYINQSFDQPFPTLGTFLRHLAEIADKIEAQHHANEQARIAAEGQGAETGQTQAPENSEPAAN